MTEARDREAPFGALRALPTPVSAVVAGNYTAGNPTYCKPCKTNSGERERSASGDALSAVNRRYIKLPIYASLSVD